MDDEPARTAGGVALARGGVVATLVLVAGIDLLVGREASLTVMMVFGPFVASALTPTRDTALTAVAAVAGAVALGWPDGTVGTAAFLLRTAAVAVGGLLAVWLAAERSTREQRLTAMTHVAEVAQRAILRPLPSAVEGLGIAVRYVSATAEAKVGGDFYEVVQSRWGHRVLVGDVRGKGLDAVRMASQLVAEFRSRALADQEFQAVVTSVERVAAIAADEEDFATALFLEIGSGRVRGVRCGHPLPIILTAGGAREADMPGTLPLGLGAEPVVVELVMPSGARLLLFSDGAVETKDAAGHDFDLLSESGKVATLAREDIVETILRDLRRHAGGVLADDVVLVVLEPLTPR
jgi:serine phosphatase RsbU (regulator of sigma subunit)